MKKAGKGLIVGEEDAGVQQARDEVERSGYVGSVKHGQKGQVRTIVRLVQSSSKAATLWSSRVRVQGSRVVVEAKCSMQVRRKS